MSLLKTIDPATGSITEPGATAPAASATPDVPGLLVDARARLVELVTTEMHKVEDQVAEAVRKLDDELRQTRAALERLREEHATLREAHAASERKLDVLRDLKAKLEGL